MKNEILTGPYRMPYPGSYTPVLKEPEVEDELKHSVMPATNPPVNMIELDHFFKIEMATPGVKREDLLVYSDGNILSINILHKNTSHSAEKFQLPEFDHDRLIRQIILPAQVDSELAIAQYYMGILRIYLPKVKRIQQGSPTRIVVY